MSKRKEGLLRASKRLEKVGDEEGAKFLRGLASKVSDEKEKVFTDEDDKDIGGLSGREMSMLEYKLKQKVEERDSDGSEV